MADRRSRYGFTDLADLTRTHLGHLGGGFGDVVAAFARAAGPELARVAQPVSLKDGTLRLRCSSASWAQALRFQEADLIERLRAEAPDVHVTRIHAIAGAPPTAPPEAPPAAPQLPPATPQLDAALDDLVAGIEDPAMRARLRAAASASTRRAKSVTKADQNAQFGD